MKDFSLRGPTTSQERGGKKRRRLAPFEMTGFGGEHRDEEKEKQIPHRRWQEVWLGSVWELGRLCLGAVRDDSVGTGRMPVLQKRAWMAT